MIKVIKDYHIIEEKKGGMAIVYHGLNSQGFERAFKVIRPDKAANNQKLLQRFNKEISTLKKLSKCSKIVKALEVIPYIDKQTGDRFTVLEMEWLNGKDLNTAMSTCPNGISLSKVRNIALQVLEGLRYAHQNNILHLDLTPSNIFLQNDGQVKIIDFGIAKVIGENANIVMEGENLTGTTETGESTWLGKRRYASPEQYAGSRNLTFASDIYSFGRVLQFMITGNEEMDSIIKDRTWEEVVRKCIQSIPHDRYQNCDEVIKAIQKPFLPPSLKKICINKSCGASIDKEAAFCPKCGANQVPVLIGYKSTCGSGRVQYITSYNDGMSILFCPDCGKKECLVPIYK